MPVQLRRINSANVVGILPGTDAKLRDEAVLYTAHHDHLGKVTPVPPATDGIYNGALDNASGCATVLAIARAVTFAPPKRSVIVSFVTAEEQGLLGSEFLGRHPPIPANRIAADINLDSVNRWGKTTDLGVLGLGKSTTDEVVRKVAGEQGRTVHGDPHPDRGAFYRSDMFSMAHVGVPPVAVKGGPDYAGKPKGWGDEQMLDYERKHYHQPSDEYRGDWDLSGDVQDAQLQLVVGLRIANAPQLPSWTPGDEFEAARKQASR
jgi:Zn-dependent M28 family amino/carboxypeptidase